MKDYYKQNPWKKVLSDIKQRCNNSNNQAYKNYGGRGIKCLITEKELIKLWYRDKASSLKKPTIDRKENDGNYTYKNCRFIEHTKNSVHRRNVQSIVQYNKKGKLIKKWASFSELKKAIKFASKNDTCFNYFYWKIKNNRD